MFIPLASPARFQLPEELAITRAAAPPRARSGARVGDERSAARRGRRADTRRRTRRARPARPAAGRASARARRSARCPRSGPCAQRSSARRIGAGSTSRISLPMYCICRRRPSCAVIAARRATASTSRSGRSETPSGVVGSSATSASPRSCSACISCLRRVFDGARRIVRADVRGSSRSDPGGASGLVRGRGIVAERWQRSGDDVGPFAMIADRFPPTGRARAAHRVAATAMRRCTKPDA